MPGPTTPIIASSTKVQSWVKPMEQTEEEIKAAQEKYLDIIKDMRMEDGFETTDQFAPPEMPPVEVIDSDGTAVQVEPEEITVPETAVDAEESVAV